jgi:hypothetical protein
MMIRRSAYILILLGFLSFESIAQKKKSKSTVVEQNTQPSSIDAYVPQQSYAPVQKKSAKAPKVKYDAREAYYKRLELVAKQKRYAERQMLKPQYSDPSYFGHKKKPKRRPPGKIKYCKECGIRH